MAQERVLSESANIDPWKEGEERGNHGKSQLHRFLSQYESTAQQFTSTTAMPEEADPGKAPEFSGLLVLPSVITKFS